MAQLNFISQSRLWPSSGLLWLVPAAALLAFSFQHWQQQQQSLHQVQRKLNGIALQQAPAPKVQRSAEEQRALDMHAALVANAVRQINLPLPTILKALQPAKDIRVALMAIDLGGKTGGGSNSGTSLKLTLEAKSSADMVNYVAYLDDQNTFASVYLQKHEIPQDSKEGHYRFQVEVVWQP